jgi:hypothetical protein
MVLLLAYARHAGRGDSAWVTQRRLMQICKVVSMSTVVSVRRSVVRKGWLVPIGPAPARGGTATLYRLAIPPVDTAAVSTEGESDTAAVSTAPEVDTEPVSNADVDTPAVSNPEAIDFLDESSDTAAVSNRGESRYTVHSRLIQLTAESDTAAVSLISESAPPIGGVHAYGRAGADAHAREGAPPLRGAPAKQPAPTRRASMNGGPAMSREDAIAYARRAIADGNRERPRGNGDRR